MHDLPLEAPLVDGRDRAPVRLVGVRVERLAREVPLVGEHLGGDALRHDLPALEELLGEAGEAVGAEVRAHRDARHVLDARGDDDVEVPGLDRELALNAVCIDEPHWRSVVAAQTVSGQPATSSATRPTLSACSPTWLTHPIWTSSISAGSMPDTLDEAVQHLSRELVGADAGQRPVLLADRAAHSVDDEGVRHQSQRTDRHFPGTPFSSCSPRSSNSIPEPATRSLTVLETSTSPAQPMRRHAPRCARRCRNVGADDPLTGMKTGTDLKA